MVCAARPDCNSKSCRYKPGNATVSMSFAMMDFLLGDVRKNRFPGRLADRKSTVAALPAEIVMALAFYDSGRAGFEIIDQFGEGDLSGEPAKNMEMVFHTADLKRVALQAPQGSGQIGMHLRPEFAGRQEWHSIKGERMRGVTVAPQR